MSPRKATASAIRVHGGKTYSLEVCNTDQIESMRPISPGDLIGIPLERLCGHCMSAQRSLAEAEDA